MISTLFNSERKRHQDTTLENLKALEAQVKEASDFINAIKEGIDVPSMSATLSGSDLGIALLSMKDHLDVIATDERKRNWLNAGLAQFSDILRNKASLSLEALSDEILRNLVKYVSANQGAIFTLEDNDRNDRYLAMISCYAYNRKKFLNKRFELGEGLAGQCVLEGQAIHLKEVPKNYVSITSGLGEATPRSVFICPLLINEDVFGVVELASMETFRPEHIDFISKLAESIAATIKNVRDSERTLSLLAASQQQAEELKAQEEEMRQNMEEMQATQEEMERKTEELNRTSLEMAGIVRGVDATMAVIEFEPDGTIIKANENFLSAVKYPLERVKGRHHSMFVPKDILDSDEYRMFWKRLASGIPISGVFRRLSSTGDTVWLNAIYSPMTDASGEVVKVMKFATDMTAQQEMLAETKGLLTGIDATMATIEFEPDGTIVKANENFLKTMRYRRDEVVGKHHRLFVPDDVMDSMEYRTFWTRLAAGESTTGIFKRVTSSGETVWLQAIYNPIVNATGQVVKVVKFAIDITSQQEMLADTSGLVEGINATMATIEFEPDGTIVKANGNFLKTMKYQLGEITGRHHGMFVPEEVLESAEYATFWTRLGSGEAITGIFKRKSSDGETVWLNAIYNPIRNANGDVVKVVKFASDVTQQKESAAPVVG